MDSQIKPITATETYPVRHPILRAGQNLASCKMEGDDLPETFHFGAFLSEKLAGAASFMSQSNAHFEGNQYRLRGMAILSEYQYKGIGKQLLMYGEQFLKEQNVDMLWFNARVAALPFYKKMGYTVIGTPFEIAPIGTHYLMFKKL